MKMSRLVVLVGIIVLAALSRLVPHPPNFAPITAMALFGAAHLERRWQAMLVPLTAMFLSDLGLEGLYRLGLSASWGLHSGMGVIYATFLLISLLGLGLRQRVRPLPVAGACLASSLLFFGVTNLAVWWHDQLYPRTLEGLLACYTAALPFFPWTLLGDAFYAVVLFGGFALAERALPALKPAPAP